MAEGWHSRRSKALLETMREIGADIEVEARKSLRDGAEKVMSDAKKNIHSVSGDLANSMKIKVSKGGAAIRIEADAENSKGIPYGRFVEFCPGRKRPYMYPALDANYDEIKNNTADAIRDAIRRHSK